MKETERRKMSKKSIPRIAVELLKVLAEKSIGE